MRVLLVKPIIKNAYQSISNLGLGYLSAALKKANHTVEILDCVNKKITFNQFEKFISSSVFDVVGLQIFFTDPLSAKKCLQIVKKHNPGAVTIIGGICPSTVPQESLNYFTEADFGFIGEAEIGLPRLINKLPGLGLEGKNEIPGLIWRDNNEIVVNSPIFKEDLDSLGMPDWDLINPRDYNFHTFNFTKSSVVAPLIVARGCPYHCTFCSTYKVTGRQPRAHSVNYIIDQIKFLSSRFGIKEVSFFDDDLIANVNTLEELCYQMIKQKLKIDWSSCTRIDKLDKHILKLMERAGCYIISVGIESGSQRILDHMQKGLYLERIRDKAALIRNTTNIKLMASFILGYPLEEEADILKTVKFAKNLPIFSAAFYNFNPIPGTSIYQELVSKGELEEKFDWDSIESDRKAYAPKSISLRKLLLLYRWAYISFYARPGVLLNFLKEANSFEKIRYLFNMLVRRLFKK